MAVNKIFVKKHFVFEMNKDEATAFDKVLEEAVELILKLTGCHDYHKRVQECFEEQMNLEACEREIADLKECVAKYMDSQKLK